MSMARPLRWSSGGAATIAVVPPLRMRVMRVAHEAPGLSSSVNIGAFNPAMRSVPQRVVLLFQVVWDTALCPVMGPLLPRLACC